MMEMGTAELTRNYAAKDKQDQATWAWIILLDAVKRNPYSSQKTGLDLIGYGKIGFPGLNLSL